MYPFEPTTIRPSPHNSLRIDCTWLLVPVTAALGLLSFLAYFRFRVYCLIYAQETPHHRLILAWFFFAVEFLALGTFTMALVHLT